MLASRAHHELTHVAGTPLRLSPGCQETLLWVGACPEPQTREKAVLVKMKLTRPFVQFRPIESHCLVLETPGADYFESALEKELRTARIELVCLAGFMRLLTPEFVAAWRDRILNIHPSLLPAFRGLDTHARALAAGVRFSGCTVHFVRAEMDAGPIIAQAAVPVRPDDDAERLAARVLAAEHQAYRLALALVASGRARVEAERVVVADAVAPESALLNPAG